MGIINELSATNPCGCGSQNTVTEEVLPSRCGSYNDEECGYWSKASCTYWDGDDYPEYGVVHGMRMTEVILKLMSKLKTLEEQLP